MEEVNRSNNLNDAVGNDSDLSKEEDQGDNCIDSDEWEVTLRDDLIGDYSRPFALPRVQGRQPDLATISCSVLTQVVNGVYDQLISSYKLIDCRYPYEYAGGHIKGAINLYKYKHIFHLLRKEPSCVDQNKSHLLIFYCEFSSSRAPRRLRFLRKVDREHHIYPSLSYPECYVLHGGYKAFFLQYKELCIPQEYKIMKDPDCLELYFSYKAKTRNSKMKLFQKLGRPQDNRKRPKPKKKEELS